MVKPKILVIEDHIGLFTALEFVLEPQYELLHTCSALQALELIVKYNPDLILADNQVRSNLTGLDILKYLYTQQSSIPVIMMSGDDISYEVNRWGAKAFLAKPFNLTELIDSITYAIEEEDQLMGVA